MWSAWATVGGSVSSTLNQVVIIFRIENTVSSISESRCLKQNQVESLRFPFHWFNTTMIYCVCVCMYMSSIYIYVCVCVCVCVYHLIYYKEEKEVSYLGMFRTESQIFKISFHELPPLLWDLYNLRRLTVPPVWSSSWLGRS